MSTLSLICMSKREQELNHSIGTSGWKVMCYTFGAATKPLQKKGCTNHPKHDKEKHKWKLTLQAKSATHAYSCRPEKNHHHQTAVDKSARLECAIIQVRYSYGYSWVSNVSQEPFGTSGFHFRNVTADSPLF